MATTRRRKLNRAAGARLVAQYGASGITQREFCERRRVSIGTLHYWLRKVVADEADFRPAEPQLVEVSLLEAEPETKAALAAHGGVPSATKGAGFYEVVLAGARRLRVPPGFDASEVAVLLTLLERRAC